MTPHERAAMRGAFMYREKNDRVTAALLYASQTSAKARKLYREIRRIRYTNHPVDDAELSRLRIIIGEATENLTTASESLAELERPR